MGRDSGVEWCDHSWSPWMGCKPVSAGCHNCYAFRMMRRYGKDPTIITRTKPATFNAPLKWKPGRIFVCPWSDFFIEKSDPWRNEAWEIMSKTPQHTYLILTKRPERIIQCLPKWWNDGWAENLFTGEKPDLFRKHIWLGITIENRNALLRLEDFSKVRASHKFISAEPLLEDIASDIENEGFTKPSFLSLNNPHCEDLMQDIDWIIAGSESGPNARFTDWQWIRNLRDYCQASNIKFFLKQMREGKRLIKMPELDGKIWMEVPNMKQKEDMRSIVAYTKENHPDLHELIIQIGKTCQKPGKNRIVKFNRKYGKI